MPGKLAAAMRCCDGGQPRLVVRRHRRCGLDRLRRTFVDFRTGHAADHRDRERRAVRPRSRCPADAAIMLAVVLIAQAVVQAVVQTELTEGRLALHPIVIFGSTIAGGALFGLLGAALSTPIVAISVLVFHRLTDAQPVEPITPAPSATTQPAR